MFKLTPTLLVLGAPPCSTPWALPETTLLISGSKFVYLGRFGARNQRLRPLTEKVTAVNFSVLKAGDGRLYAKTTSLNLYTVPSNTAASVAELIAKVPPVPVGEK